jgi:hypothetical protein
MYALACLFFLLSIGLVIAAAYTNPSVTEFATTVRGVKPSLQTETETIWEPALSFLNSTPVSYLLQMNFTLSGNDLSVGQPVFLRINASAQEPITPYVASIAVEVENTFQSQTPYASIIELSALNKSLGERIWLGNGLFEFNTVGPLIVAVSVLTIDKTQKLSEADLGKTILPNLVIGPSGSGQVRFYEDQNLSLTLFILFFASMDIAVTLYDHSYIEESKNRAKGKHDPAYGDRYCPE